MLNELTREDKVVGVKQVRRALASGRAKRLYLAKDADPQLTQPLAQQGQERGVEVVWADTMKALGRACGIAVGAAVAATV
ncbi:MAG: ribosomal L7Ae/L30e/S12e/Gadd45 family protein [Oscillospiraceae bacterium]|nr:ribosomal L7Ae/L30e/S12e/Gadd45 family protein [Oscillospiraceae bacterium]